MSKQKLSGGAVHELLADLARSLYATPAVKTWESLTPITRNEWICWNISANQDSTRANHIKRTIAELQESKRRPCCWIGYLHRTDKAISLSVQSILTKRAKAKS